MPVARKYRPLAQMHLPNLLICFQPQYLCACGSHITPGPKTSLCIRPNVSAFENARKIMRIFRMEMGESVTFRDNMGRLVVPSYDGFKGKTRIIVLIKRTRSEQYEHLKADNKKNGFTIYEDPVQEASGYDPQHFCACEDHRDGSTARRKAYESGEIGLDENKHLGGSTKYSAKIDDEEYDLGDPGEIGREHCPEEYDDWEGPLQWYFPPQVPKSRVAPIKTGPSFPVGYGLPSDEALKRAARTMRRMR